MNGKPYLVYYWHEALDDEEEESLVINLERDYAPVTVVDAVNEEAVYAYMQAEIWSPNGEARELIESLGLTHTSMSIGDVLYDIREKVYYKCVTFGFLRVDVVR